MHSAKTKTPASTFGFLSWLPGVDDEEYSTPQGTPSHAAATQGTPSHAAVPAHDAVDAHHGQQRVQGTVQPQHAQRALDLSTQIQPQHIQHNQNNSDDNNNDNNNNDDDVVVPDSQAMSHINDNDTQNNNTDKTQPCGTGRTVTRNTSATNKAAATTATSPGSHHAGHPHAQETQPCVASTAPSHLPAAADTHPTHQHTSTRPTHQQTHTTTSARGGVPRGKRARPAGRTLTEYAGFASGPPSVKRQHGEGPVRNERGRRVPTRLQPWSCGLCTFDNKV